MIARLAVIALGLCAGATLAEGAILVPFWISLPPESFLAWYRQHAALLLRCFGPLEVGATALAVGAAVVSRFGDDAAAGRWTIVALLSVLVLAMFPLYFQRVNASFAAGTIAPGDVGAELHRWACWHWLRVGFGIVAFATAVTAVRGGE